MKWFSRWHTAYGAYIQKIAQEDGEELRTDGIPLPLNDLLHFQLLMDLISLGGLLGEGDAVRQVAAWVAYHLSSSPAAHMRAKLENLPASEHAKHDAFHYDEAEVKAAVNKRKTALRKKHGNLPSLKEEK